MLVLNPIGNNLLDVSHHKIQENLSWRHWK